MRTREERVKNKMIQVMKKIKRMSDSKDIDYTMDELVISKKLSIKIECLRGNEKDFTDEIYEKLEMFMQEQGVATIV